MNSIEIPGFTAHVSIYNLKQRYLGGTATPEAHMSVTRAIMIPIGPFPFRRAAAEANGYSCFVQQAALRLFSTDPEEILASDAVKRAEDLADEVEEQGYFRIYSPEDVDLLD